MRNFIITAGRQSVFSGLAAIGLLSACTTTDKISQSSEYDDMYFTADDRDLVEFTTLNEAGRAQYDNKGSYQYNDENYSSKNVNPDLIAEYQNDDNKAVEDESEYYVEEQDRAYNSNRPIINNNYYGQPYGSYGAPFYNNPYYDPFFSSAYGGFGRFGYDPFYSSFYRPGFSVGFGFGMAFGNAWGWGNPYYGWGRPFGYGGFYDPYYGYAYGFNPYYGGFGYGGYNYWNRPNVVIINNNDGINTRTPARTNVPTRVSRSYQQANVASTRNAVPNRTSATQKTRTSYNRTAPDFSSQNAVSKSDFRREANRRILSNTDNTSRRSSSYTNDRSSRQYTNSTRNSYNSRNYNSNNNRSFDFGSNSNSRSNNSFNTRSSSGSGSYSSGGSYSNSRPTSGGRGGGRP